MDTDGTLSINEYVDGYTSTDASSESISLWTVSTGISGSDINIEMSDSGCLTVTGGSSGAKWELCSTFESEPDNYEITGSAVDTLPESSETTTTSWPMEEVTSSPDAFTIIGIGAEDVLEDWRLLAIVSVVMLCILCCICSGCICLWRGLSKRPKEQPQSIIDADSTRAMTHAVHAMTETKSLDFSGDVQMAGVETPDSTARTVNGETFL